MTRGEKMDEARAVLTRATVAAEKYRREREDEVRLGWESDVARVCDAYDLVIASAIDDPDPLSDATGQGRR